MKRRLGIGLTALGLLLIVSALVLTLYNLRDQDRAGDSAARALDRLETELSIPTGTPTPAASPVPQRASGEEDIPDAEEAPDGAQTPEPVAIPDYVLDPNMDMPEIPVDQLDYIGILEIPALNRTHPVVSRWSTANLKYAPCRYAGSAYQDNLIIAGHNYVTHFGTLKSLVPGDEVVFTDAQGEVFSYRVSETELLDPTEVEEMASGDWDLTLFTCTLDGAMRITVRCTRVPA